MPFLLLDALGAVIAGLFAGAFAIWCASRYGQSEKRYLIQFVPVLACGAVFCYLDIKAHTFFGFGIFNLVFSLTARLADRKS